MLYWNRSRLMDSYFDGRVSATECGFRPQTITSLLPAVTDKDTSFSAQRSFF